MRPPTPQEEKIVIAFFEGWSGGTSRVLGDWSIVERDGLRVVVKASRELQKLPAGLRDGCDSAGLAFGILDGDRFRLDLQGALALGAATDRRMVKVSEHASRLFLYGRAILGDSVEHHDPKLRHGDDCLVANPRGEVLGIGTVVGKFKGPREAVHALHDLGSYLRDQDA